MLKRILIANRGEIAVRVIRACREMGIESVAVYSTADAGALHVQLATRAVCIGPARAAQSYLNQAAILTAAVETGCQAVHPGYGFLSENAEFADLCEKCGLKFIGPSGDVIRRMGNKSAARALMQAAGVPVVPGSDGIVQDAAQAAQTARRIGYPVLIKASAGGGGRGMRRVFSPDELAPAFAAAQAEAKACFGDGELYLEKLILKPRHIEFQIMADQHGHVVHLGERDCSIQRKNQKLMEESPSRALTPALRAEMGACAVAAAKACGYEGAGTVEFVLDQDGHYYFIEMNTRIQVEHPVTEMVTGIDLVREQLRAAAGLTVEFVLDQDGHYYFIEMNTRIQVEHPVTEMVTGIDLVREQLRAAAGLPLSFTQDEAGLHGHAIEVRINAEDPAAGFRPCPGKTEFLHFPGGCGVRVDSALYNGCELSPYYDSMVAKIIVHAPSRLGAIRRMRRALEELVVEGYPTGADLAHLILYHPEFLRGSYNTGFLEEHLDTLMHWGETGVPAAQDEEDAG